MIYRSNLVAPDPQPLFPDALCYPRPWSFGHDVMSDPEFDPECGFATHDEAAILYECACRCPGNWVDVGSRTGWSALHISEAKGCRVECIEIDRAISEKIPRRSNVAVYVANSRDVLPVIFGISGAFIDGNHETPIPKMDANDCVLAGGARVVVFHDFWGRPIREGVEALMDGYGMKCRVYNTPNGMAVCWRGDFVPPDHVPDPAVDWAAVRKQRAPEFDFARCE